MCSREDHFVRRQVLRDRDGNRVSAVALGSALQQIEIVPVVGELHVYWGSELGLQQVQQFTDEAYEGSLPNQSFKGEDCILRTEIRHRSDDWLDPVMAHKRYQIANLGICGARIAQEFRDVATCLWAKKSRAAGAGFASARLLWR